MRKLQRFVSLLNSEIQFGWGLGCWCVIRLEGRVGVWEVNVVELGGVWEGRVGVRSRDGKS